MPHLPNENADSQNEPVTYLHIKKVAARDKAKWMHAADRAKTSFNPWVIDALNYAAENMPIKKYGSE
jgi:hypothetical protein